MKNTVSTESKQNRQATGFYRGNIAVIASSSATRSFGTGIINTYVSCMQNEREQRKRLGNLQKGFRNL
ncbi:hypothetical protein E3J74_09445 [Candidatus Bathyarchaeota archaeon]|nr:MAG: hypothetical protein E3J74_09445 [Candidatus Bathyarchaeota archaeon]